MYIHTTSRSQTSTTHTSSRKGPSKEPFVFLSFFLFFSSLLFHLSHAFHVPLKVVVWGKSSSVMLSYKNPRAKRASTRAQLRNKRERRTKRKRRRHETTKIKKKIWRVRRRRCYRALFVLALLVRVSLVSAFPREKETLPSTLVQRNQQVRAEIAVG